MTKMVSPWGRSAAGAGSGVSVKSRLVRYSPRAAGTADCFAFGMVASANFGSDSSASAGGSNSRSVSAAIRLTPGRASLVWRAILMDVAVHGLGVTAVQAHLAL